MVVIFGGARKPKWHPGGQRRLVRVRVLQVRLKGEASGRYIRDGVEVVRSSIARKFLYI